MSFDVLSAALTDEIRQYVKTQTIPPGIFCGWDCAELNDGSALTVLVKEVPTFDNPNPKLKCRVLRDISINQDGLKNITIISQCKKILEYDKRLRFSKLIIDETNNTAATGYLRETMGSRVEGLKFTRPVKSEMIYATKIVLQEGLIEFNPEFPYFPILKKQLYQLDPKTLKHPSGENDDFVWSLAMAIKATSVISFRNKVESGYSSEELIF